MLIRLLITLVALLIVWAIPRLVYYIIDRIFKIDLVESEIAKWYLGFLFSILIGIAGLICCFILYYIING